MGHPVPPDEPDIGECPDCCEKLPCSLNCRFTVPDETPYTGILEPREDKPCEFVGDLFDGPGNFVSMYLTFCKDDGDTEIICGPPLAFPCRGVIINNNHCWPWIDVVSTGGCHYEVWP